MTDDTDRPRITRDRYRYELADGTTGEIAPANPDLIAWEKTAASRYPHFGTRRDTSGALFMTGTITQTTFAIWHALKRSGAYTDTFEQFRDSDLIEFEPIGEETVNPT